MQVVSGDLVICICSELDLAVLLLHAGDSVKCGFVLEPAFFYL